MNMKNDMKNILESILAMVGYILYRMLNRIILVYIITHDVVIALMAILCQIQSTANFT